MPDDAQLTIVVTGAGGRQWTFSPSDGSASCPTIERRLTGDGPVSWSYPFVQYEDVLPHRHAHVSVRDSLGEFHTARVVLKTPPPTDCSTTTAQITARGYDESLTDRKFDSSTIYGPRYVLQTAATPANPQVSTVSTLAATTHEAVTHAVSQLGESVSVGSVTGTGVDLEETEDFLGRPSLDVINSMIARQGGLATPYTWAVRRGIFTYRPLDTAARYAVTIGEGVTFQPTDDASKIYTHVIVVYGKGQAVDWPDVLEDTQLPTTVDLVVNAGTEVKTEAEALDLAKGLYGRLQTFELGWSGQIVVAGDAEILELGSAINPWRMDAGHVIRTVNLDPFARYGDPHMPSEWLVSRIVYDGSSGNTTIDVGEFRDVSGKTTSLIRRNMFAANSRSIFSQAEPNLSTPTRDNDKARIVGPQMEAPTTGAPPPLDHGLVAVSPEQQTVHPDVEVPKPVTITIVLGFWSGEDAQGDALTLPFREPPVPIPPMQIDRWEFQANVAATLTYKLYRKSTNALVTTVSLTADDETGTNLTPASNPALRIVTKDSLIPELTVADANTAIKWAVIRIFGSRLFPGYKGGAAGAAVQGLT